jgi:hypothetical protein
MSAIAFFLLSHADSARLMATPDPEAVFHVSSVEATDLVTVHVLLEEEAFTRDVHTVAILTLPLAVLDGFIVVVRLAILRVSIADSIMAIVSQVNLPIWWAIVHPVDRSVAFPCPGLIDVLNSDFRIIIGRLRHAFWPSLFWLNIL